MVQLKSNIKNDNKFLFTKPQFKKVVDFIPYMVFDNYFVCPCSLFSESDYFPPFKVATPILYFKCESTVIFKDTSELLSHLKPLVEFTGVSDNINRYHQILYYWLIIYRQISTQGCPSISSSKNNKKVLNENIHQSLLNKNCKVKTITHVNSKYNTSIFKSPIIQPKTNDNFVNLTKCEEISCILIDNSKHIKTTVNSIFGTFPKHFFNNAIGQILFLLNSSHMNCFIYDVSQIDLTYGDIKLFDSKTQWLNDNIIMCFLRWMSLQSSKIAVLDLRAFDDYKLQDAKSNLVLDNITELNLIIVPISSGVHFYLFLFIRINEKGFLLMQLDSLHSQERIEEMSFLKKWFLSNDIVINEKLELELFYLDDFDLQMDSNSCACYVCLYSFYASKLSDKIISKDQWKEHFNELLIADCDIVGFRVRLNKFCLLMKKDVMKSNINLKRNIDQMNRYVTPYDNIFDNAVSITKFDLSLNSY